MTATVPSKALEWTNLTLGSVLVIAPFLAGLQAGPVAVWNACLIGAVIITCSAVALGKYGDWVEWTNVSAGTWLVFAPFLLGFASVSAAMWTHVLVGLCVATIAGIQLYKAKQDSSVGLNG